MRGQVNGDRDVQVVAAYVGEGELMGCATSYFYGSLKYELFANGDTDGR